MRTGRTAVVAVASLLAGAAVGYLVRGRVESAPAVGTSADRERDGTRAPGLAGGGAPASRDASAGGDAPEGGTDATRHGADAAGGAQGGDDQAVVVPVLEVSVVAGAGTPADWGAIAYVLPAGAHGVDRVEDVPHQSVSLAAPARIPILVPGRYDVVVRHAYGCWIETDVRVGREDATVRVALPPMAPIRFRVTSPPPTAGANQRYVASLRLEADLEKGVRWPGRGEALRVASRLRLDLGGEETRSPEVPSGSAFAVIPDLTFEEDDGEHLVSESVVRDLELVPSTPSARGGDVVTLSMRRGGTVALNVRSDLSEWPAFPVDVGLGFERTSDGRWETESVRLDDAAAAERWLRDGARFPLPAGTWSIEWGNHWIEPGRVDGVEVRSEATTERAVEIRARRRAEDAAPRIEIDLDDDVRGMLGDVVWKSGRHDSFTRANPSVPSPTASGDEAIVSLGRDFASAPATPPAQGPWRPRLERAGALVVALDRVPEPAFGRVTVRRVDGFPLGVQRSVGADDFQPAPEVAPGTVLGPFAPGPLRLEVLVGGQRLRDVDVVVRADRIETLRVSLPRTAAAR